VPIALDKNALSKGALLSNILSLVSSIPNDFSLSFRARKLFFTTASSTLPMISVSNAIFV
jgi:hypothetical protein